MITITYINYWKDPHNDEYFTKFIEHNIGPVKKVKHTENPDILIASCIGDIKIVQNIKSKCKIFYYGENLDRYPPYNNDKLLFETFDLIVGFKKTDLSKKQIRFPLWLMYYKYYNYEKQDNILTYIQNKYNENIKKEKEFFCSVVSRHDRGRQRTLMCNEMAKYGVIKSPGIFRNNTQPIGNKVEDKINFISKGLYNICPENSCYEGYCTEKIFHALEGGTIPLYWGIDLPEPEIINKNKYCFWKEETLEKCVYNPEQYIDGEIFTENAENQIKLFYSTLVDNISSNL